MGTVRFNVRGKLFEVSTTTLASVSRNSMLGAMLADEWNLQPQEDKKEYYIDRNPDCFSELLDLLGTGKLNISPNISEKKLYTEAQYYGLLDHVRSAKIGKFGNLLKLKHTVKDDQALHNWTTVRASPDGGCAVAQGNTVCVYDWMLDEYPPLNLDYQKIKDMEWVDSENIVMSVCHDLSREVGGIGVLSSSTSELKHKFQLNDGLAQVKSFDAGSLCSDSDSNKIYASCRGKFYRGIGVWDQVTGKQTDFLASKYGSLFGEADKVQWLNGCNLLFVKSRNYLYRDYFNCCVDLLDVRDKSKVWSWENDLKTSDLGYMVSGKFIVDAIPIEESNSICVVSSSEELGFIDIRSTNKSIRWNPYPRGCMGSGNNPKLIFNGGRLFCSMKNEISVYNSCVDQWTLTSRLERRSQGGLIRDFSIGGDRLFALHSEENVVDVWETPSAPILKPCF